MHKLILKAAVYSIPVIDDDPRGFWIGCIGIRNDQRKVIARNGSIQQLFSMSLDPTEMQKRSEYHAEGRILNKMTKGGEMFVARISRQTGELMMARPCGYCRAKIRSYRINKVYYSVNNDQYGVWLPQSNTDRIF